MRRSRLLTALLAASGPERDRPARRDGGLADPAGAMAAAACEPEDVGAIARRLGPETLSGRARGRRMPDRRRPGGPRAPGRRLRAAASDRALTLGPTVAARCHRRLVAGGARRPTRPGSSGMLGPATGLLRTDERARRPDPGRGRRRVSSGLPPGASAPSTRRRRRAASACSATLVGLARQPRRDRARRPTELGVHPQTVRYRLARLRELLGDKLDDPETRFEISLALRGVGADGHARG